jgi:hypothetical protein
VSEALTVASMLVAMLAVLGGLAAVGRWAWQTGAKMTRLADGLLGEPPGPGAPNGRPGVLDRLTGIDDTIRQIHDSQQRLEARVSFVEAQMRPNGGTTMADKVDRIVAVTDATPQES